MSHPADSAKQSHAGDAGRYCLYGWSINLVAQFMFPARPTSSNGAAPFAVSGGRTPGKNPVRGAVSAAGHAWWTEARSLDTSLLTLT